MRLRASYNIGYNSSDGIALEIYLYGCKRVPKCQGCHNPELWDFKTGSKLVYGELRKLIEKRSAVINNFVILGGEPLDQDLQELDDLLYFLSRYNKPIWLYTSYDSVPADIGRYCTYIKYGRYEEHLKAEGNVHFGVTLASSNQIIRRVK